MEPFIEVSVDEWPKLINLLEEKGLEGVVAHTLIDTQLSYEDLRQNYGYKVYCIEGDINNDVIAIDHKRNFIFIFPENNKNTEDLENALLNTSLLDLNRFLLVCSTTPIVVKLLEKIKENLGVVLNYDNATKHFLPKTSNLFNVSDLPNTYVSSLKPEDIDIVDSTWRYHGEGTSRLFKTLIKCHLTWVLYSTENNPIAWITVNETGALTHLYCLEEYRKKGYAEYVAKVAINDLLKRGKNILCYTIESNYKACKLFTKLGFKIIGNDTWISVTKNK